MESPGPALDKDTCGFWKYRYCGWVIGNGLYIEVLELTYLTGRDAGTCSADHTGEYIGTQFLCVSAASATFGKGDLVGDSMYLALPEFSGEDQYPFKRSLLKLPDCYQQGNFAAGWQEEIQGQEYHSVLRTRIVRRGYNMGMREKLTLYYKCNRIMRGIYLP